MMLFKLSLRNLKKSMKDYMIYFATLILGVAIFYIFNAMEKQTVMLNVGKATSEIVKMMNGMLSVISVFVAFVLGFLIVYASNFLMKRRKREFGIYMILGMSKKTISSILLIETMVIGAISLVTGLVFGMIASQGMSIVVANMFEADMTKFSFVISTEAIGKTMIYFFIIYIVVLIMNTFVVGKTKLIKLLNAGKSKEKNMAKNPIICSVIFIISVIILSTAYYSVTAGAREISSEKDLIVEVVKGIVSTLLIFWSISGILTFICKKSKKFYHRGLNSFTVNELGSRINTTVFSGTIICLMLFITICVLSSAMSIRKAINDNLKEMAPMDINLCMNMANQYTLKDVMEERQVDVSKLSDEIYVESYRGGLYFYQLAQNYIDQMEIPESMKDYYKEKQEEIIKISDYNRVAKAYGIEQYSLNEDEYMVVADFGSMVELRNQGLKETPIIRFGEKKYHPKYKECKDGFLVMAENHINFGIILVPDDTDLSGYEADYYYLMANYKTTSEEEAKVLDEYFLNDDTLNGFNKKWPQVEVRTKRALYEQSIGMTAMVVFIGIYLGIIFMISGAAILALKELSEAVDNKEKYEILRKIGVDQRDISKTLFVQCAMFFGLPLLVAAIHSIFGIQVCMYILETIGKTGLLYSIVITAIMIGIIYGIYFLITYYCSKKIIET